ncbi:hypothetical protein [Flagellimonas marina]|uniref:Morphogenetic protein n=1 Tax=Flagellimonas marina TaxID=1775168 RepID=A0ABV8PGB3_9FLAO
MKTSPMLYKPEMVSGILKKIKTETRRTNGLREINQNPDDWDFCTMSIKELRANFVRKGTGEVREIRMPYGHIGDVIWVRETWQYDCHWTQGAGDFVYKADNPTKSLMLNDEWKPSIHMPKDACRLFLRVLDVRIERLHDISNESAIAEGIAKHAFAPGYKNYINPSKFLAFGDFDSARTSFFSLWISINGESSFDANPWVWVYSFEITDKPKDFLK